MEKFLPCLSKECRFEKRNYPKLLNKFVFFQTSYCNPSGYIHETLTVYKMIEGSSYLVDRPSTEFSWFPGYSWQILLCNNCQVHIGWKFIALKKNLAPRSFFGLSGKSLVIEKAKIASTDGGSTENEIQDVSESFE